MLRYLKSILKFHKLYPLRISFFENNRINEVIDSLPYITHTK